MSTRMGGKCSKVLLPLAGASVLDRTLQILSAHPLVNEIILAVRESDRPAIEEAAAAYPKVSAVVTGGATRAASVRQALLRCGQDCTHVAVHDAARPLLHREDLDALFRRVQLFPHEGCILAAAVTDSLRIKGQDDHLSAAADRDTMVAAQTPQVFPLPMLLKAYEQPESELFTDEAAMVMAAGLPVSYVAAAHANFKLTTAEDMLMAEALLEKREGLLSYGLGWDIHRLIPVEEQGVQGLMLGGVLIPYEKKFLAHSDGDVLLHAIIDAMLGAANLPDIGRQFPDTDPAYAGISSMELLSRSTELLAQAGKAVRSIDCVVIAQQPKLAPWWEQIQSSIAQGLGISVEAVSCKAKTAEGLGEIGRGEAAAAQAIAVLMPLERGRRE